MREQINKIMNFNQFLNENRIAKNYGDKILKFDIPKSLNILNSVDNYSTWEDLCDEFDVDNEEIKYEPTIEFINFLKNSGYDGFENNDNILIFDKTQLKQLM